jgi:hypothetical protein
MSNLATSEALFRAFLNNAWKVEVIKTDERLATKYYIRAYYRSKNNNRLISKLCKTDKLPLEDNRHFRGCMRALYLTDNELRREFSAIDYRERKARRSEWLAGGADGKSHNIRVVDSINYVDKVCENIYKEVSAEG